MVLEAPTKILLVEDNKIDARLIRQAIECIADWPTTVEVLDDGEKAMRWLAEYRPDLVILDLHLPKRDGSEVLQFIRESEELAKLMVFVLTTSPPEVAEGSIREIKVKADAYIEKPFLLETYFTLVKRIKERYLQAAVMRVGV